MYIWGGQETQFFFNLTPEMVLDTASKHGLKITGRCLTLNSMENRVYELEIENPEDLDLKNNAVVAKFYRPGRWSEDQIRDEHQFMLDLIDDEIPVIAPLVFEGETLFKLDGHEIFYTFFPKKGGRAPDEMNEEELETMGRMLARLHNIGETKKANHRIKISPKTFGLDNLNFLLTAKLLPNHLEKTYQQLVEEICQLITPLFFKGLKTIRIHGDCHCGNVIHRPGEGLYFIDFDDMLMGPAIQDIWLINPGTDEYSVNNRNILLDAYQTMRDFNYREIHLIEPLRTLRFIHFSAWIAKRWDDPAFKTAFSHFAEPQYWDIQINDLRHQKLIISQQIEALSY